MDGVPKNAIPTSTAPPSASISAALAKVDSDYGLPGDFIGGICDDGPCLGEDIFGDGHKNSSGGHVSITPTIPNAMPAATGNVWGTRTLNEIHGPPGSFSQISTTGPNGKPTILPVWFEAITGVAVVVYLVVEGAGLEAAAAAAVVPPPPGLPGACT